MLEKILLYYLLLKRDLIFDFDKYLLGASPPTIVSCWRFRSFFAAFNRMMMNRKINKQQDKINMETRQPFSEIASCIVS